jgi:hypothetical protein
MALRGNLRDFSLPDVFQLVTLSGKSGVLRIKRADAEGSIWFRDGEVFFAQSDWHREPLGTRLVTAGKITPNALSKALDTQRAEQPSGRRLGKILVDEGFTSEKVLEAFVQEQIQDTIFDLFRWDDGDFDFETLESPPEEDIGLSVSIENIVMEGSRRLEEWTRIKKKIPSMDIVFKMATAPGEGTFDISLKPAEWNLLLKVDGTRSVAELARELGRTDFEVARIIYGLFSAGLLEVASDEETARLRAERAELEAAIAQEEATRPRTARAAEPAEVDAGAVVVSEAEHEEPAFLSAGSEAPSAEDIAVFERMMGAVLEAPPVAPTLDESVEVAMPGVAELPPVLEPQPRLDGEMLPPELQVFVPEPEVEPEPEPEVEPEPEAVLPPWAVLETEDSRAGIREPASVRDSAVEPAVESAPSWEPAPTEGPPPVEEDVTPVEWGPPESGTPESGVAAALEALARAQYAPGAAASEPVEEAPATFGEDSLPEPAEKEPESGTVGVREAEVRETLTPEVNPGDLADLLATLEAEPIAPASADEPTDSGFEDSAGLPERTGDFAADLMALGLGELPSEDLLAPIAEPEAEPEPEPEPIPAVGDGVLAPDTTSETAGVISTDAFLADFDSGDVSFSSGLGDELTALTGGGTGRTRPVARAAGLDGEGPVLHRDSHVDRELVMRIIEGVKRL